MNLLFATAALAAVMALCGIGDKIKQMQSPNTGNTKSAPTTGTTPTTAGDGAAEKPALTSTQQSIMDSATEATWTSQGISWKLPAGWKKTMENKDSFDYASPDNAFLLAGISKMPGDFPTDSSLKATYDSSLEKLKQGDYESARYLEIDGIKGVEFVEVMPEDKSGPRRFQWIAFRNYQGQSQQLNIMLSTKGSNFDKHRDDFAAIMYSIKIPKG